MSIVFINVNSFSKITVIRGIFYRQIKKNVSTIATKCFIIDARIQKERTMFAFELQFLKWLEAARTGFLTTLFCANNKYVQRFYNLDA